MRTIYLVRHGVPDFPDGRTILQGRYTDLNLNPKCYADAAELKSFFKNKKIINWYSSPLKRAQQTLMQFIPEGKQIEILKDAAELYFGRWEGKSWEENMRNDPALFEKRMIDNTVLPPGAENMQEAAKRMFHALQQTKGTCVIVAHWTVISLVYCLISDYPFEKYISIPHPYLGVTKISETDGLFTVDYIGKKVCNTPFCDSVINP